MTCEINSPSFCALTAFALRIVVVRMKEERWLIKYKTFFSSAGITIVIDLYRSKQNAFSI